MKRLLPVLLLATLPGAALAQQAPTPSFDDRRWQPAPRASAELIGAQERWTQGACQRATEAGNAVFALEREELWLRFGVLVPEPR